MLYDSRLSPSQHPFARSQFANGIRCYQEADLDCGGTWGPDGVEREIDWDSGWLSGASLGGGVYAQATYLFFGRAQLASWTAGNASGFHARQLSALWRGQRDAPPFLSGNCPNFVP